MKRKTNLFYTDGPDSKFLTFSNYTESLTGNFLSTDTKLFPDKFLCLKLHNLNKGTKKEFIKYLVRYYENKLATLRDFNIENDEVNEKHELPLAYLLEAILNVCDIDMNGFSFNTTKTQSFNLYNTNEVNEFIISKNYKKAESRLITYIGSITEQDYNGTYTDTICSINANEYYEGDIIFKDSSVSLSESVCKGDENILHGWENETIFEEYFNTTPLFDDNTYHYKQNTLLDNIEFIKQPKNENNELIYKNIEFNIIIPLFSVTNINYTTNSTILESEYNNEINDNGNKCIKLDSNVINTDNVKGRRDIPLGIWIYADENKDTFITLKRDSDLQMYPSWSLLIASQFKPFPYTLKYQKENDINKSALQAYPTFSEVLSKVNDVLDIFNQVNSNIVKLDNRINSLERQVKELGTQTNITQMENKFLDLHNSVQNEINDFKKLLYGYIDNITWSSKYKNN